MLIKTKKIKNSKHRKNLTATHQPPAGTWSVIPNFPDYLISKDGRVWDLKTGLERTVSVVKYKGKRNNGNYRQIQLMNDTGSHMRSLNCLLKETFGDKYWDNKPARKYNRVKEHNNRPAKPAEDLSVITIVVNNTQPVYPVTLLQSAVIPCNLFIHDDLTLVIKKRKGTWLDKLLSFFN